MMPTYFGVYKQMGISQPDTFVVQEACREIHVHFRTAPLVMLDDEELCKQLCGKVLGRAYNTDAVGTDLHQRLAEVFLRTAFSLSIPADLAIPTWDELRLMFSPRIGDWPEDQAAKTRKSEMVQDTENAGAVEAAPEATKATGADEKPQSAPKQSRNTKKGKVVKPKSERRPGVINTIIRQMGRKHGATVEEILDHLVEKFPERKRESMNTTVRIQIGKWPKANGVAVTKTNNPKRGKVYKISAEALSKLKS